MDIGLALSGGGTKGAAHIGVLRALKEENIDIDYISGTSSGSIIAILYALGYSNDEMKKMFTKFCNKMVDCDKLLPLKLIKSIFTGRLEVKGFASGKKLQNIIYSCCIDKKITDISKIKMPIAIPTVDIKTGEIIYFINKDLKSSRAKLYDDIPSYKCCGRIDEIVRASCSLPGVYIPKIIDNNILVDGGTRMNTPVNILKKMGAKKVIAISFDGNKNENTSYDNIFSIAMQSFDIMGHHVNELELASADIIIRPKLKDISVLDCRKIEDSIFKGYEEIKANIKKIKDRIS